MEYDYFQNFSLPSGLTFSQFSRPSWADSVKYNFNSGTESKPKSGGGMFDPLTAGLGLASAGIGAIAGIGANRTQASIANAQMAAAADQMKWNVLHGRDMAKFGEGGNIGARVAQGTWMPDLEFGRQKEAAMFDTGPLAERRMALATEGQRRGFGLANSAEAKEISQRDARTALKQSLAERQAQMMGAFGRIAPVDVNTLFT
jgi:hypothetical protein